MKDYILNLLSNLLDDNISGNDDKLDIAFLQDEIKKAQENESYYNSILLDFNDEMISKIVSSVLDYESFYASLMYIKSLLEINKKENIEIPISNSQKEVIGRFVLLVKQKIDNYDEESKKIKKARKKALEQLKNHLINNELLTKADYDLIEKLIIRSEGENANKKLNEVMTFLNEFNYKIVFGEKNDNESNGNVTLINGFDSLTPQSFNYVKKTKKNNKKPLNFLEELNVSEDSIGEGVINVLNNLDNKSKKQFISFIKKLKISNESIIALLNRSLSIFIKPFDNFKNNCELALSYNANLDYLVEENITYFLNSYDYNKNKLMLLSDKGIDVKTLFNKKPKMLAISTSKLLNNILVLESYNFDLSLIDYDNITIIGNNNLSVMLDLFIESGFSEYIFLSNQMKNLRSLIIKRLYYTYKNELSIWQEGSHDYINEQYNEYILKERKPISEEEIRYLIGDYPILDSIEEGKRPILFNDALTAQIKRKYEFRFDNIIISRLKTYSVFKVLISHNVEEKEALLYALTYNSNLTNNDYLLIRKIIIGK